MKFIKMQGLGNDFIIIDNIEHKKDHAYLAALAPQLCRRHFGIGADGLVILDTSAHAPFRMRIFNADGSEAEMCGNAIRCLAKYVWERGYLRELNFDFETAAGIKNVTLSLCGRTVDAVRVNMGKPVLNSKKIPLSGPERQAINEKIIVDGEELYYTALSMGNPHCVIFVQDLENKPYSRWGRMLEKDPLFPQRTNVEFVEVDNPETITVKVWERGAGLTLACGTGACAAVVAGVINGHLRRAGDVKVNLPGGILKINWDQEQNVYMEGPAEEVFHGEVNNIFRKEEFLDGPHC
ncbi:MAG TPA: diaminopimelate epimerase [Firmicutes bacterium]|nr:diaminopimelate epimerase [Bacillota bacterium]